ncbi:HAD hydrolase-like protein [Ulvibacterium sp.]|uniref:HAD hydrolase-like protein n=1 Tax=Ulvibacterium sp. TaxID=2665914 RepID=UPI003BACE354
MGKPEIPYDKTISEVYKRMLNNDLLEERISFDFFSKCFQEADFKSEINVQFLNQELVSALRTLQKDNYRIVLVSDFHLPGSIIERILKFHRIETIFSRVYVSTDYGKSKQRGGLYETILEDGRFDASKIVMMGDNKSSDFLNPKKHGLQAIYLKHLLHKFRNKRNILGDEQKTFDTICRSIEGQCRKSNHPLSEYILHYYFFTERLYTEAKKKGIKNLFFLAREGMFLKKLFEHYQDSNGLLEENRIATHYLKASRQSAMQVSLQSLEKEEFRHLKRKTLGTMSLYQFLESFQFPEDHITTITQEMDVEPNKIIPRFVTSEAMSKLRQNKNFELYYERMRHNQKKAFLNYLDSFNVDFRKEGMVLVDVGWGGTMQDCIYEFLEQKVEVTGYYLGLRQVYNIQPNNKRFGLNFSIYPSQGFSDHVLKANTQLYEQLLAAPHGSTLYYKSDTENPTFEYHEANEKRVFQEFIAPIQEFMFDRFIALDQKLKSLCYTDEMVQNYITNLGLRVGLLTNRKKLSFIQLVSQGFHQNIGNNQVGLVYSANDLKMSKLKLLKQFLWTPETIFRYLVKLRPMFYGKGKPWLGWPVGLAYYYIRFNRWLKEWMFKKNLI